jgi:hypothetical protein
MRLYTFTNYYLSSLQKGLQSAHVVSELFSKYNAPYKDVLVADYLWFWANDHRTIIIKDGGNHQNLMLIAKMLNKPQNPYPWALVREDGPSLNKAATAVGIVLPEKFYKLYKAEPPEMTEWENTLKHRLVKEMKLAI